MHDNHLTSTLLRNGSLAFFLDTSHLTILNSRKSLFSLRSLSWVMWGWEQKPSQAPIREWRNVLIYLVLESRALVVWVGNPARRRRPTNGTHSIVTAVFVPVGLARSNGAAQGGMKLFSAVHVHPNILLRRGTEGGKGRKKNEWRKELAEVSGRLPRRGLVLKSSLWSRLFCLSSCHITSCLGGKKSVIWGNQVVSNVNKNRNYIVPRHVKKLWLRTLSTRMFNRLLWCKRRDWAIIHYFPNISLTMRVKSL